MLILASRTLDSMDSNFCTFLEALESAFFWLEPLWQKSWVSKRKKMQPVHHWIFVWFVFSCLIAPLWRDLLYTAGCEIWRTHRTRKTWRFPRSEKMFRSRGDELSTVGNNWSNWLYHIYIYIFFRSYLWQYLWLYIYPRLKFDLIAPTLDDICRKGLVQAMLRYLLSTWWIKHMLSYFWPKLMWQSPRLHVPRDPFHRTCPSFKANPLANYFQIGVTGRDSVGAQFKKNMRIYHSGEGGFRIFFAAWKMKDLFLVPDTRRPVLSGWKRLKSYQNSPRICGRLSSFLYRRQFPLF